MDGCFRLGESLGLYILIFFQLPTNCFHSFFVWIYLSVFLFVYNCLCALRHGTKLKKDVDCYQWICFYGIVHI